MKRLLILFIMILSINIVNADLNEGLIHYYPFNEGTGTNVLDSAGQNNLTLNGTSWTTLSGSNAVYFNGVNNYAVSIGFINLTSNSNRTYSFLVKQGVQYYAPSAAYFLAHGKNPQQFRIGVNVGSPYNYFAMFDTGTSELFSGSNFNTNFITLTYNKPNMLWYINGELISSNVLSDNVNTTLYNLTLGNDEEYGSSYMNMTLDELKMWNRSLNSSEIRSLYYSSFNGMIENSQEYTSPVSSSSLQQFKINISYDPSIYTSSSAVLVYNGTSYSSSATTGGAYTTFTSNINVPTVTSQVNYSFFWNISLTNSSGVNYFKSNSNNQTVTPILFGICSPSLNNSYVNFTIKDIITKNTLNATFKSTWYIGSGTSQNYSFQDLSELNSSFSFCFSPPNSNYTISASIEYDSSSYARNFYYLTNSVLTNKTTNITLYLLNDSLATLTTLSVLDSARKGITDVYTTVQYYDVGTDTFYTVAMAKSGYDGKDIIYLNWYDSLYRFSLVKDGKVIYLTNSSKISSTPQEFLILDSLISKYDKFESIIYSLTFNNATSNFVLTFTDPTGLVTAGCLKVIRQTMTNSTVICNSCQYSSSATLYCNINAYGNGTYIASFYALGSYDTIYSILEEIGVLFQRTIFNNLGNLDASFYAFLFAGITCVFFFITPVLGILGVLLGVLGAVMLGFNNMETTIFMGITIIGGVIIWFLKR